MLPPLLCGAEHFDRHHISRSERKIFGVILWSVSLCHRPERQNDVLLHLAFLQFFGVTQSDFALSPYFFGLVHFDRIIELGEQTGAQEEIFKILLKMVPSDPRFFSYQ